MFLFLERFPASFVQITAVYIFIVSRYFVTLPRISLLLTLFGTVICKTNIWELKLCLVLYALNFSFIKVTVLSTWVRESAIDSSSLRILGIVDLSCQK